MILRKPLCFATLLMWALIAVTTGIVLGFGWRGLWPRVLETPSVVFLPGSELKAKTQKVDTVPGTMLTYFSSEL